MGKILKTAFKIYLAAYIGFSGHAFYDYNVNNKKRIETEAKNSLVVRNYKVDLEGKIKELTIVGEAHIYNHTESAFAKELVKDYEHVAYEGTGRCPETSIANTIFGNVVSLIYLPSMVLYGMGSGRLFTNPSIERAAVESCKDISYLEADEDDIFSNMSLGQKFALFGICASSFLTAPLSYYGGKEDLGRVDKNIYYDENIMFYAANLHERDKIMAKNIEKLLKREDIDKILCVMGKAHVIGVEKSLEENIKMEREY